MTSRGPTEALGSGIVSDPGAPRVQTVSRGTYALVGPPPGRTETFWGQAEEDGTAVPTAMTRTPGGWQGRTTAPGVLPGAEAYNSRRTPLPRRPGAQTTTPGDSAGPGLTAPTALSPERLSHPTTQAAPG